MGICLTEDYMPLLSRDTYATFAMPCVKRIAEAFGGVFVHCCGTYRQHLPTWQAADFKVWGLESAFPQTPVWDVYAALGDRISYLVGVSPDGLSTYPTKAAYAQAIAAHGCDMRRFWWCAVHGEEDIAALKRSAWPEPATGVAS
jgi:hypothetical protein